MACSGLPARDPRVRPVENLAELIVFQGFSVLPPQGRDTLQVFIEKCTVMPYNKK